MRNTLILVLCWEIIGRLDLVADGALPGLSEILYRLWQDRADYPQHLWATLYSAASGFVIGNLVAILAGILFSLSPTLLRLFRGVNIALFAIPPIAIAPIFALTLSGMAPRIVLAALGCYFVTMTATVIGLSQFDSRTADVVRAYGGSRWRVMLLVQWRGALPGILSGLRVAAPNAVLGAILAEFGGGGRWGLGTYLLGSLGRGEPDRLWGIGLVATAIAAASYGAFALLSRVVAGSSVSIGLDTGAPTDSRSADTGQRRLFIAVLAVLLPLLGWYAFVVLSDAPPLIAKTPLGVLDYLLHSPAAESAQSRLLAALGETLPLTLAGMLLGIAAAFLLAVGARLLPGFTDAFMPIALVTQTMPLVALTPLLVLIFGRGLALTMWVTVSVTFFPAFVTIAQGLALVPQSARDVPRAYGASALMELRLVSIPAALPWLFAAVRLTAPRALLGVMIAEWLATGKGLGNLLNQSRGYLDYGMIWTVAAVSVILSILFYQVVVVLERYVLGRLGMATAE